MQIREFIDIQAKGRSPYPFINAIRNSAILCGNQYCKGEIFFCRILKKDLPELEELAAQFHMSLTAQDVPSLMGKIKKYKFRLGIPAGILLSIAILFYYSNIVTTIEIQGNETISDSVILSQLKQNGLHPGVWIANLDTRHCETELRVQIPGIAWAGIRNTGNRFVIQITEETPQPDMLHERVPCHVISRYDAQITNVRVLSGQLQRLIRDGVAEGEIIVSGIIQDENGSIHYRHALAEITGIYTQETDLSEPFQVSETSRTGRNLHQRWLRLFGLKLPLQLNQTEFSESDVTEYDMPFQFLNHTLPCGISHKIINETQTSVITRTEEEAELSLNTAIIRYEKNFLSDVKILDRQAEYITNENGISCHLTYTVEGEIGMTSEFFIPEPESEPEETKTEQ